MKGLMFNVLESLATEAGCSEEAWELVAEFAATEALLDPSSRSSDRLSQAPLSYTSPAEAMVRCLSQGELAEQRSWDILDAAQHQEWFGADGTSTYGMTWADRGGAGFSAEAFIEPDALLTNWSGDTTQPADSWEEEEQANRWIREEKAAHKRRS